MRPYELLFGLLLAATGSALAQPIASFDVSSIKLHSGPITFIGGRVRGTTLTETATTLHALIEDAYGLRIDQVSGGPDWISSDRYDIAAKAENEDTLTMEQAMRMLRPILVSRFQLRFHRETKEMPVYELVVGKNGSKINGSSADAKGENSLRVNASGVHVEAIKEPMEQLARQLSTGDRPVLDKTGLAGYYAFKLDWLPANRNREPDVDTPSMFTAVQEQLGLKLEPAKDLLKSS